MSKRERMFEMMSKVDLPPSAAGRSRIEIEAGRELTADGCEAVLTYSEEGITLKLSDMILDIEGERLMLTRFGEKNVGITGIICKIGISGC